MAEFWKISPDFPWYMVSNQGRVRSIARNAVRTYPSGKSVNQPISEKILSPATNPVSGYQHVVLRKEGKSHSVYVHFLVARTFVDGYASGLEVCHNDGKRSNNLASNLRWDTRQGNLTDTIRHGTKLQGETQNGARLTAKAVLEIRRQRAAGITWAAIAKHHDIAIMTAHAAGTGRSWKHLPQNQPDRPIEAIHAD